MGHEYHEIHGRDDDEVEEEVKGDEAAEDTEEEGAGADWTEDEEEL